MALCLHPNLASFASLGDGDIATTDSTRRASRLMSMLQSQGRTEIPEHINSNARFSEPLVSVCHASADAPRGGSPARTVDTQLQHNSEHTERRGSCPIPPCRGLRKVAAREWPSSAATSALWKTTPEAELGNATRDLMASLAPAVASTDQVSTCFCSSRGRLSVLARAQLDGQVGGDFDMTNVTRNIRALLCDRKHDDCGAAPTTLVANENALPSPMSSNIQASSYLDIPTRQGDHYLICQEDIEAIVEIVIAGIQTAQRKDIQPEHQPIVSSCVRETKPIFRSRQILPGASSTADTATTICSTQPYLSWTSNSDGQRHLYPRPRTTYISRQSITESLYRLPKRQHSWPQPPRGGPKTSVQRVSFNLSPYRGAMISSCERQLRRLSQRSTSEPLMGYPPERHPERPSGSVSMTSFPRLKSRSCTNDWLTPLGLVDDTDCETPESQLETVADLYSHGVDAHTGVPVSAEPSSFEDVSRPASPLLSPGTRPDSTDDRTSSPDPTDWWANYTRGDESSGVNRLGRSIGSASHKRISDSVAPNGQNEVRSDYFSRSGRYSLVSILQPAPRYSRRAGSAPGLFVDNPQDGQVVGKDSSRDVLRGILGWPNAPLSTIPDSRSMTARQADDGFHHRHSGKGPCPEDGTPHICTDELWTPESDLSFQCNEG
ncbi:hypothetical protein GGS20DRAFT_592265 [Poronia punctata]|nr:hypothetical protein GGS20DRAFT_592265 [Poronia punctata]